MSSKLHGLVWEGCAHAGLILSRVAVMARLADYSNDEGVSWPAVETIQRQIGAKSKTTVSAAIDELERDGWLKKTERKSGGRNLSNIYQINVEKLELAADTARKANKAKKQSTRTIPPIIDPSNINPPTVEGLTVDPSNIAPPTVEGSTIGQITPVKGSMVDPDPSLTTDPSDKRSSCPGATPPDEGSDDDSSNENFISRHPDAVVFSAKKRQWGNRDDLTCAEFIWGKIIVMYERAAETDGEVVRPREPNWTAWANEVRLMVAQDGRTHKQICSLFKRANQDKFWSRNILSPAKLREKWDELTLKLSASAAPQQSGPVSGGHWNSPEAWENTL
ncbi:helix-turn-helix domain-containing protein [Pantoea agglomerans]|uniref:helix-turn-helix domain-containing protein n=1 Tax=Enterobacter agglomerans TaxID=549 RepID=UPI0013B5E9B3|nr:helix-turn-helix domain-containing protein [Pantoea agglomerans]NEG58213.1 helix-turn-helix domain-containing protein [Pantoea agglomerans]NEG99926.1 helix-turn-helix domain-containing protein [Pantoea agglomerans]NEH04111.1 helix-turn-helix domain-containing protein [Pantoea agglomerans]NEH14486.1 helix-turn-helix domain-containing protein [Pantoea agglomerans]